MKRLVFIGFILFFSCKPVHKEFKLLSTNIELKIHQFGEGVEPNFGQVAEVYLLVRDSVGDTLHYVPDYPYFILLENSELDSALTKITEGDSITLRVNSEILKKKFKFYQLKDKEPQKVKFDLRLLSIHEQSKYKKVQLRKLSDRELKEQLRLKLYLEIKGEGYEFQNNIYRKIQGEPTGDSIVKGSEVSLHYKGSFLDGYVFDDTYKKGITPTFQFGKEHQFIEGIQQGLVGLKEGQKVKIILPSRLAFGEEGSLSGIVPPYTAVKFEINIIKVIN